MSEYAVRYRGRKAAAATLIAAAALGLVACNDTESHAAQRPAATAAHADSASDRGPTGYTGGTHTVPGGRSATAH